jgi:hypothetical protein
MKTISKTNIDIATEYYTGNTRKFDKKDKDYQNLLLSAISDDNSSTLREQIVLNFLGYDGDEGKHGRDGSCQGKDKEVKPIFVKAGHKVGNSGNFNDMTLDLLKKKENFDVICAVFTENKLISLVEFPFSSIYNRIKTTIGNAKIGKRVVCPFSYKDYDSDSLKVHYFDARAARELNCFSKGHFDMLMKRSEPKE